MVTYLNGYIINDNINNEKNTIKRYILVCKYKTKLTKIIIFDPVYKKEFKKQEIKYHY